MESLIGIEIENSQLFSQRNRQAHQFCRIQKSGDYFLCIGMEKMWIRCLDKVLKYLHGSKEISRVR